MEEKRKLKRVTEHAKIAGVCAGFAYWLGAPLWAVRLVWVFFSLFMGWGLILYLLFWIFMPKWEKTPADFKEVVGY